MLFLEQRSVVTSDGVVDRGVGHFPSDMFFSGRSFLVGGTWTFPSPDFCDTRTFPYSLYCYMSKIER